MVPTQLFSKLLQCMYLKQQAINTLERGLHEVMTHCERSMCPWDIHHFDFVLVKCSAGVSSYTRVYLMPRAI